MSLRPFLLAFAVSLVWSGHAVAEAKQVHLSWVRAPGAESCIDSPSLHAAVRERLGRDPFSEEAQKSIEGIVNAADAGYGARLLLRGKRDDSPTVRELSGQGPDCDALSQAVVLAVAVAIDPERALVVPEPTHEPPQPTRPAQSESAEERPSDPPAQGSDGSKRFGGRLWAGAGVVAQLVPGWATGLLAGGDVRAAPWLDLSLGLLFVPEVRRPEGFGFGSTQAHLSGCFRLLEFERFEQRGCAGLQAGVVHAVVYREDRTEPGQRLWLAGAGGVRSLWHAGNTTYVFVQFGAALPVLRYRFFVEGTDHTVHQQPRVVGQLDGGIGIRFE